MQMSDQPHISDDNFYRNHVIGATPNPVMQDPDDIDESFAQSANQVLSEAAELARALIGAHQSAIAIIVQKDWTTVRKYFSLSSKYAAWANYSTAATGYGIHGWLLDQRQPIRLTQDELLAHPEWKNFGTESSQHPPMRGWLAAPLLDVKGTNWGLFQLSDKYQGDFTAQDEQRFVQFVKLVSIALEALWDLRNARKGI
jgi:GAF domain-containing protein